MWFYEGYFSIRVSLWETPQFWIRIRGKKVQDRMNVCIFTGSEGFCIWLCRLASTTKAKRERRRYERWAYVNVIELMGSPIWKNCSEFIDETSRSICRLTEIQKFYFGHQKEHHVKYRITNLRRLCERRRHSASVIDRSNVYEQITAYSD